ncbi:MAG TPA: dockerin type I domain-containing protein [Planctomycetota bacterium]|nr:dockerin type I domain-containing protein [Planctomycetota bacterium]
MKALRILAAIIAVCSIPVIAAAEAQFVGGAGGARSIQAAIDTAKNGDVVIVRDGVYSGKGNREIDFRGKQVTVCSENGPGACAIDCGSRRGFIFRSNEGRESILAGLTIVNAAGDGPGGAILCVNASPVIAGNRIAGNSAASGAAVFCRNSSAMITGNQIACNRAMRAAGIDCSAGSGCTIIGNAITANDAEHAAGGLAVGASSALVVGNAILANAAPIGGGMLIAGSNPIFCNNVVAANSAQVGGGICLAGTAGLNVINNTLAGNTAEICGGAACLIAAPVMVRSCILWDNKSPDGSQLALIASHGGCSATVRYCDLTGGQNGVMAQRGCSLNWGDGMLDVDPLFVDASGGNFHLQSRVGRWEHVAGTWVKDDKTSPCIDAGDPTSFFWREIEVNGGRVNMGAYGNTREASRSARSAKPVLETLTLGTPPPGKDPAKNDNNTVAGDGEQTKPAVARTPASPDINNDGTIDRKDMEEVRSRLNKDPDDPENAKYDVNGDGRINILDLIQIRNRMAKDRQEGK